MTFYSILFEKHEVNRKEETFETPDYFRDLNLDQVIDSITALKEEYDLKPVFHTPLHNSDEIQYRQEIMQDLEKKVVSDRINVFAQQIEALPTSTPGILNLRASGYFFLCCERNSATNSFSARKTI